MKSSSSAPRDCAGNAPLLTALFDGEADAVQTSEARAHLLNCPACSRLWLDWTQHRAVLQSEPEMPPPPTLLWRVLIAYRVAAYARPARRRSRLPEISATSLRGLEAPLPPQLSQHIFARTTRKPSAHVLLTPLDGPPRIAPRAHWKNRSFRRASSWAAPALALWILMLGRAEFAAFLPSETPVSSVRNAPRALPAKSAESAAQTPIFAPIPIAPDALAPTEIAPRTANNSVERVQSEPDFQARAISTSLDNDSRFAAPNRSVSRAGGANLGRALLLAMSAGRRDFARVRNFSLVRRASVSREAALLRDASQTTISVAMTPQIAGESARSGAHATPSVGRSRALTARVDLVALSAPVSSVRTRASARVRLAAFSDSDDAMRPRVARPSASANGRRLARVMLDDAATPLRFSRPLADAPTLREVSFSGADGGPRIDELRSAVDDFRASISGDNLNGE